MRVCACVRVCVCVEVLVHTTVGLCLRGQDQRRSHVLYLWTKQHVSVCVCVSVYEHRLCSMSVLWTKQHVSVCGHAIMCVSLHCVRHILARPCAMCTVIARPSVLTCAARV